MRIVTWNLNGGDYAPRAKALVPYAADVEVLSEVLEFRDLPPHRYAWAGLRVATGRRHKGVGIVVREGLTVSQLDDGLDPTFAVTRVDGLAAPVNVVGIWSRPPYEKPTAAALVSASELFHGEPFVAAGDFNSNGYARWLRGRIFNFASLLSQIEGVHDLRSAYHSHRNISFASETEPTLYWLRKRALPFHIDFVFIPSSWCKRLVNVEVGSFEAFEGLSDHRPVVVDIGPAVFRKKES